MAISAAWKRARRTKRERKEETKRTFEAWVRVMDRAEEDLEGGDMANVEEGERRSGKRSEERRVMQEDIRLVLVPIFVRCLGEEVDEEVDDSDDDDDVDDSDDDINAFCTF
jgi:hypothetical protein